MIELIPLEERHLGECHELEKACFSMPWSYAELKRTLEIPLYHMTAVVDGGTLVGYCGFHAFKPEGYILNVAVLPSRRREGIASLMLQAMEASARGMELEFLSLEVRRSNLAAIALYEKHGYRPVGIRPDYYEQPAEDALIMTFWF